MSAGTHTSAARLCIAAGLWLAVFALLALSGPGRIDIVDGQTRFEVARSLITHGDFVIRDPRIWFARFPGRDGEDYTSYRFPQSLLGAPAIFLSDVTGGPDEARRHFFFSLTSALAAASLAVVYFLWFERSGIGARKAAFWACAGIFCTPAWFYGTSTFDDILGSAAVVAAIALSGVGRGIPSTWRALEAGLLIGLAFNCKQPLLVFILPVLASLMPSDSAWRDKVRVSAAAILGASVGVGVYLAYDLYKFPAGTTDAHATLLTLYHPIWPGTPLTDLAVLAVSPAAGVLWYCPPVVLAALGLGRAPQPVRRMLLVSSGIFILFIASMAIFKGDPSWGPRYLTAVIAVLWLFAPQGAERIGKPLAHVLLAAGLLVQLAALSVDPHRLYVERRLPSAFGAVAPVLYFDPRNAHLVNRPRELIEIWEGRRQGAPAFSPAPSPTFAFPVLDFVRPNGPAGIQEFKLLNSFRPWWASHIYVPADQRPISIGWGLSVQLAALGLGLWMLRLGLTRLR